MSIRSIAVCAALVLGACAEQTSDDKPEFDPHAGLIDDGKADYASNRLTHIVGGLVVGEQVEATIDAPDYLLGYTLAGTGGQTIAIEVKATDYGVAAVYGPAVRYGRDGQPKFRRPLDVKRVPDGGVVRFEFTVPESGTYLVVYGPYFVWRADFRITTECLDNCRRDGECFGDDECSDDTFCAHNGVVCVRAPCDVSFNACMPQGGELAPCDRDRACGDGLACVGGVCQAADVRVACEQDTDCADAFCRCTDQSCDAGECTEFSAPGEGCGGFVPPHFVRRCDPDHACVVRPHIADVPGRCSVKTTVDEVLANPAAFAGEYVAIDGFVNHTFAICTQLACSPENPCCNSCGAGQLLFDAEGERASDRGLRLLDSERGEYHCGGNNCSVGDSCTVPNTEHRVFGFVRYNDGFLELEVDDAITAEL